MLWFRDFKIESSQGFGVQGYDRVEGFTASTHGRGVRASSSFARVYVLNKQQFGSGARAVKGP